MFFLLVKGNNYRNAKLAEVKNEWHHGKQIFTIIWFAFNALSFQLFNINRKLRFWINNIFTSVYFYAEIQAKIRTITNRSFHAQIKTSGQSRKIVEKNTYDRFQTAPPYWKNACYLRISFYPIKEKQSFTYRLRK